MANMSIGDYRKAQFEEQIIKEKKEIADKKKEECDKKKDCEAYDELQKKKEDKCKKEQSFVVFRSNVRKSLLSECILKLYNNAIGERIEYANEETIKRCLVNKFIEENGTETIINKFKNRSYVLSEFARNINDYSKIICEKAKKDGDESINPDTFSSFMDSLDTDDVDDVSTSIKIRVSNALSEFNSTNAQEKQEIKDIIRLSQNKIDSATTAALKESYERQCKSRVSDVRGRKKNLFSAMVYNIAEASMKNEKAKKAFTENNELNIASIVERVELLYTFLETLNTAKIEKVNEDYIMETLKGLKA